MPTVRIMGILQLYPFFDLNKNIKPKKKKIVPETGWEIYLQHCVLYEAYATCSLYSAESKCTC